jgi:hypothetical protein
VAESEAGGAAPQREAATDEPATEALNGAQLKSVADIAMAVGAGQLPYEGAIAILSEGLGVPPERARRMLGPKGFKPKPPPEADAA